MKDSSIIGIDVASDKLDFCWSGIDGHLLHTALSYTKDDLDTFLAEHDNIQPNNSVVGLESTGDYHLLAARYFLEKGFRVKLLNPIVTKEYTRATIRGTKTDKTDAQLIVKAIRDGHGDLVSLEGLNNPKKEALRLSTSLVKDASRLKQRIQSIKRKDVGDVDSIVSSLEAIRKNLVSLANDLVVGATTDRSKTEEYIDSIPGFALKLSAIVSHELGDINKFDNLKSLIAYAGLDPRIKQSGKNLNTTGKLTKRGSPYLRSALFLAANTARRFDDDLHEYYDKKKGEGRTHREVLCMVSRKLLARIFTVVKEQRPYLPAQEYKKRS